MIEYCLFYKQQSIYLQKVKEVKFYYEDLNKIVDFYETHNDKIMVLYLNSKFIDWEKIRECNILTRGNLICCAYTIDHLKEAKKYNLKVFHFTPVKTYYDLQALKELGVCYIKVDAPLFFDLPAVASYNIPIRIDPSMAKHDNLPHIGAHGTWIRPEDLEIYESYIAVFDFEVASMPTEEEKIRRERALYRIYAEQKEWPGDMNLLFSDFYIDAINRLIVPDLAEHRVQCKQICQNPNRTCHICDRALLIAKPSLLEEYKKEFFN